MCFYGEELLAFVLLTQYFSGDKTEKNEMGGTYRAYGGEERHIQGFGGET
jgi:putative IMPACT (imprinted ancient) family translation regulator